MEITINQNENQNVSISNENIQTIEINQNELQTINLSNSNTQNIGVNENDNQVILIDGGGAVIGITDVLVNGVTVVSGNIAYVTVPTKTSELQNNSGFITIETDPTVPSYVKAISLADINNWNSKQNALVSGSTIKTVNNESLLGSGNINIEGTTYTAGNGISIENNIITNEITNYNDLTDLPDIPTKTSDLINDEDFVSEDDLAEVSFTGSYNSLSDTPIIPDSTSELTNDSDFITSQEVSTEIQTAIATKQDTLVSGTNIKTINSNSILGSGDLVISSGSATDVQINGTSIVNNNVANIITESAYNETTNKIATVNELSNMAKTNVYATDSTAGTIKTYSNANFYVNSTGNAYANNMSYNDYLNIGNNSFVSKGELENALTGKGLLPINTINFSGMWLNVSLASGSGWRTVIPLYNPNNVQPTLNFSYCDYYGPNGWTSCTASIGHYNQTMCVLYFSNINNITDNNVLIALTGTITL